MIKLITHPFTSKIRLAFIAFFFISFYSFGQDTEYEYYIGLSNANNKNINHPDGTNVQDLKRSVGVFIDGIDNGVAHDRFDGKSDDRCSCVLLNNANQNSMPYIATAASCVRKYDVGVQTDGYFSFDFEIESATRRGDRFADEYISSIYLAKYEIVFKDPNTDLALLKLKEYDPKLLKYAYAAGWDNTITNTTWSNISHPQSDHKKIFVNPNKNDFRFWNATGSQRFLGYFYHYGTMWNNALTTPEYGSIGSGDFSKLNLLKAIHSQGLGGKSTAISNKWFGLPSGTSHFAKYLDAGSTWINSVPGGYFSDLVPTHAADLTLDITAGETLTTPSPLENSLSLPEDVLWITPLNIFQNLHNGVGSEYLPIWTKILGINAVDLANSDLVLSVFYLDKNPITGLYTERLIYGVHADNNSIFREPAEFRFKGVPWDCNDLTSIYPPCNRSPRGIISPSTGASDKFRTEYLRSVVSRTQRIFSGNPFSRFSQTQIPVVIRLKNIGSETVKVHAVSYPGDVPRNALQLFQPNDVQQKFISYKYPESRGQNSENLHISSITVPKYGIFTKTITTDNNGGYLNLVNPNFRIGPIRTNNDDEGTNTFPLNISIHNPNNVSYSYRVWIDYFNKDVIGGKNNELFTYNFVNDSPPHEVELISEGIGLTGNKIEINYTMPTCDEISLSPSESRLTRMRISVKAGDTPPTPSETFENGEVEDYLINIHAPSSLEILKTQITSKAKIHLEGIAGIKDAPYSETCISPINNQMDDISSTTTEVSDIDGVYTCSTFKGSCNATGTCSSLIEDYDKAEGSYAINFTGTDDIVTIDNGDVLIHNAFEERTVSFWIKKESDSSDRMEVIYDEGGGSNGFAMRLNGSKVELSVLIENQLQTVSSVSDIPLNQWTNVTGVFNKGEIDLYIAGVEEARNNYFKTNGKTIVPAHSDNAAWGGTNGSNVWNTSLYGLDGKSDELLIYDEALSLSEITTLATREISPSAKSAMPKTAIADDNKKAVFTLYPNPVKNYLNILVGVTQSGPLQLEIKDLEGKKVYQMNRPNLDVGNHLIELRNLNLPASLYILSLKAGDVTRTEKIVVE